MSTAAPKAPLPQAPPPRPANGAQQSQAATKKTWSSRAGVASRPIKAVLYAPGGWGKTELCSNIQQLGMNPLFIDLELGSLFLNVARVDPVPQSWDDLRDCLHSDSMWNGHDTVILDSFTRSDEFASLWTIGNVKHPDKPEKRIRYIEDYGYGKGYMFVYETFLQILGDLDAHVRAGRNVICTAHECTANVPNPSGEDWIRYEPRLQSPASGKGSIRLRVKEWTDHLLFGGYDVNVNENGKGTGAGTRTIYPVELPTHMAKSRSLSEPIVYEKGSAELWRLLKG